MILTPQAERLIDHAVRDLNMGAQEKWRAWVAQPSRKHIAPDVSEVVLDALRLIQARLEDYLVNPHLSEDEEADLLNDLGYVRAIRSDLIGEVSPRRAAAG